MFTRMAGIDSSTPQHTFAPFCVKLGIYMRELNIVLLYLFILQDLFQGIDLIRSGGEMLIKDETCKIGYCEKTMIMFDRKPKLDYYLFARL